ncbi:hypothetical protein GCM10010256_61620 [Streptomyces coeruleorubidus]|nr:hypothetical protein GCM10010256_61620 [Streptomyces coeruleorubidus]
MPVQAWCGLYLSLATVGEAQTARAVAEQASRGGAHSEASEGRGGTGRRDNVRCAGRL